VKTNSKSSAFGGHVFAFAVPKFSLWVNFVTTQQKSCKHVFAFAVPKFSLWVNFVTTQQKSCKHVFAFAVPKFGFSHVLHYLCNWIATRSRKGVN